MKKALTALCCAALFALCLTGCAPTAQPAPSAAGEAESVVEIVSDTSGQTPDDMDSGSAEATLRGLNARGQEVWTHAFTIEALTELPPVSPAALTGGRAYVEVAGTLYALSLSNGEVLWSLDDVGALMTAPLVDQDGTVYLSGYYGPDLLAVSKDGGELWRVNGVDTDYYWNTSLSFDGDALKVTYASMEGKDPDYLLFDKSGNQLP